MPRKETINPAVEAILERIREVRNVDFRSYKRATLHRRLERRMAERRCKSVAEYRAVLEREPAEFDALISAMLIKVTSFFREPAMWEELENTTLPQVLSEKRAGEEIRVWCAGCATGEEAFSAAIVVAEVLQRTHQQQTVKIFGTDADEKAIGFARQGSYTRDRVKGVPKRILDKYFVATGEAYTVRRELRRSTVFGVNNLVADAHISRLDVVICRNVFIYLDAALQKRVLTRFHFALQPHGILVLGKSELIPYAAKLFEPVDLPRRIYRKDGTRHVALAKSQLLALIPSPPALRAAEELQPALEAAHKIYSDVVQSLRNAVIVTSLDGAVLLWNDAAAALWGRADTEILGKRLASLNLQGLAGELIVEKTRAVREGRIPVDRAFGVVDRREAEKAVQIMVEVSALRDGAGGAAGLVYTAHDVTELIELQGELRKANQDRQSALEELQTTNEEMQSSNEELETTNEELQSANEELQTTNEELQSTNEELETANEELQSINAELDATDRELAHRTSEMTTFGFIQRTIIRSLGVGVIVLDEQGRVKVWNLAAERLLGVGEDDAMNQVLWTLHVPALSRAVIQRLRKTLQQQSSLRAERVQYELPSGGTGNATVAAIPIIDGGKTLGSLIMFEDVTRFTAVSAELAEMKGDDVKASGR
ncbi:MAG TPA: CheR family methyltransferase [Myxococcales bacterium]